MTTDGDQLDELRGLALAALGYGLLSFQRLQVRRRRLEKRLADRCTMAIPR